MRKNYLWLCELAFILVGLIYVLYQTSGIYGGDAGDLVSAALVGGIAHPPGYPLFVIVGYILTKIPVSTVAWRVTLLSSVTMAGALYFCYRTMVLWLKRRVVSLIAALSIAFSYLVWLFASVPEVFGLYVFFVSLLFYLCSCLYFSSGKGSHITKLILLSSFLLGLSLTHHHAILFFLPANFYLVLLALKNKKIRPRLPGHLLGVALLLFLIGLSPYFHPVLASKYERAVFWNRPDTPAGFVRLVTRGEYGTFVPGSFVARDPVYRFGVALTFLETIYYDLALLGIILVVLGFVWLWKKTRPLFWSVVLAVGIGGLVFSVYASFPVHLNFVIGTYERFLLPSYIFLTIPLAAGMVVVSEAIRKLLSAMRVRILSPHALTLIAELLLLVYPLRLFHANYPKIAPLRTDKTADQFAEDVLSTVPPGGVLTLSDDTFLFDSQYVYYTQSQFQDRAFLHLDKLAKKEHRAQLSHRYPYLVFPDSDKEGYDYLRLFIEANTDKHPVYANEAVPLTQDFTWVQLGLLKRAYAKAHTPKADELNKINEALWLSYHDPLASSVLFDYHLLLRDVLRAYGNGHRKLGETYLTSGQLLPAEQHILAALRLEPWWWANNFYLGQLRAKQGKCQEAEENWLKVIKDVPQENETYALLAQLYTTCFHDEEKARQYQSELTKRANDRKIPLKSL